MNINNYIDRNLPRSQVGLRVPFNRDPVPNVDGPIDTTANNYSIAPKHKNEDDSSYSNVLPPAPRSQLVNYPEKTKSKINPQPYKQNSCYLVDNKDQGVVGLVCNNAGGSNNSNPQRGNEFSNDYYWLNEYEYEKNKIDEYSVERPVQVPMDLAGPTMVYKPSNYFPLKTWNNREHPWNRTYPKFKNYTASGLPIYTYPNGVLNNIQKADGTMKTCIDGSCVVEGFDQLNGSVTDSNNLWYFFAIIILLVICIIYFL